MAIVEMLFKPPLIIGGSVDGRGYPIRPRLFSRSCDKKQVYRVRYRAYQKAGWIAENDRGEFSDDFDELASAFSIGAFYNGDCVGSLRLAFGGKDAASGAMPCEGVFPEAVQRICSEQTAKIVEFSRLAVEPAVEAKTFRAVIYGSLVRAALIVSYAADADYAIAAVHQKLSRFYELMCGFGFIARSERFGDIAEPTHLIGRDFGTLDQRRRARNAFFRISPQEIDAAREALVTFRRMHEAERIGETDKRRA